MEQIFIALIAGFIGGGVLMFFMKDKIVAVDTTLHAKIDSLVAKVEAIPTTISSVGQQVANHVTQQVASIVPKPPSPPTP